MELKVVGNIRKGPDGSLWLEIDPAVSGADAIEALQKNVGRVLEARLKLAVKPERQSAKEEGHLSSIRSEGISDCGREGYWLPKMDKGR